MENALGERRFTYADPFVEGRQVQFLEHVVRKGANRLNCSDIFDPNDMRWAGLYRNTDMPHLTGLLARYFQGDEREKKDVEEIHSARNHPQYGDINRIPKPERAHVFLLLKAAAAAGALNSPKVSVERGDEAFRVFKTLGDYLAAHQDIYPAEVTREIFQEAINQFLFQQIGRVPRKSSKFR